MCHRHIYQINKKDIIILRLRLKSKKKLAFELLLVQLSTCTWLFFFFLRTQVEASDSSPWPALGQILAQGMPSAGCLLHHHHLHAHTIVLLCLRPATVVCRGMSVTARWVVVLLCLPKLVMRCSVHMLNNYDKAYARFCRRFGIIQYNLIWIYRHSTIQHRMWCILLFAQSARGLDGGLMSNRREFHEDGSTPYVVGCSKTQHKATRHATLMDGSYSPGEQTNIDAAQQAALPVQSSPALYVGT